MIFKVVFHGSTCSDTENQREERKFHLASFVAVCNSINIQAHQLAKAALHQSLKTFIYIFYDINAYPYH